MRDSLRMCAAMLVGAGIAVSASSMAGNSSSGTCATEGQLNGVAFFASRALQLGEEQQATLAKVNANLEALRRDNQDLKKMVAIIGR